MLDFDQAANAARRLAAGAGPAVESVGDALAAYAADLQTRGKAAGNVARVRKHMRDDLAGKQVALVAAREWRR